MRQYSSSKKSEIIHKYLNRRESRTEFSRRYNIPVTTIDTWVKRHRKKQREPQKQPETFIPLISGESSRAATGSLSIDFPSGIRMSISVDYKLSEIASIASELGKVKL